MDNIAGVTNTTWTDPLETISCHYYYIWIPLKMNTYSLIIRQFLKWDTNKYWTVRIKKELKKVI